jgi:hypothetical protein
VKKLKEASQKALATTALYMTDRLREHAINNGWHPDVANTLKVEHRDGKFQASVHPDYGDRAFVHEYGNEHLPATAVIRNFLGDSKNYDTAFMISLNHHWKESK